MFLFQIRFGVSFVQTVAEVEDVRKSEIAEIWLTEVPLLWPRLDKLPRCLIGVR